MKVNLKFQLAIAAVLLIIFVGIKQINVWVSPYIHPMIINIFFRLLCILVPLLLVGNFSQLSLHWRNIRQSIRLGTVLGGLFLGLHILRSGGILISWADLNSNTFSYFLLINFLELPSEEILFRGFIQTRLMQMTSSTLANIITSLFFLVVHITTWKNVFVWSGAFVLSLFLGSILIKTQNLWGSIICHDLNDIGLLFLAKHATFWAS